MGVETGHVNEYLVAWSAIGPLAGILVGHFLTRSWQREQWRIDTRNQEYKELISAISASALEYVIYIAHRNGAIVSKAVGTASVETLLDTQRIAFRVLADRLYIADEIEEMHVAERYMTITEIIREELEGSDEMSQLEMLLKEVRERARNP